MSILPSRRRILAAGAGAALGAGVFGASTASASAAVSPHAAGPEETRRLDELYQAALKKGEKLVIYAGGDTPTQQDSTKAAFKSRFPGIDLTLVVDYSKYHDVRVDNQFATDTLGRARSPPRTRTTTTPPCISTRCAPGPTAGTGSPSWPPRTCSSPGAATRRVSPSPPGRRRSVSAPRARQSPRPRPRRRG